MPARIHVEATPQLMTVRVEGPLTADDVIAIIRAHYPGFHGPRIVWDLTRADLSRADPQDFTRTAMAAREHTPRDILRKTAYVVSGEPDLLMAWRYLNAVMHVHVPVEYKVFTHLAIAHDWLSQP